MLKYVNFVVAAMNWAVFLMYWMYGSFFLSAVWLVPSVMWTATAIFVWRLSKERY